MKFICDSGALHCFWCQTKRSAAYVGSALAFIAVLQGCSDSSSDSLLATRADAEEQSKPSCTSEEDSSQLALVKQLRKSIKNAKLTTWDEKPLLKHLVSIETAMQKDPLWGTGLPLLPDVSIDLRTFVTLARLGAGKVSSIPMNQLGKVYEVEGWFCASPSNSRCAPFSISDAAEQHVQASAEWKVELTDAYPELRQDAEPTIVANGLPITEIYLPADTTEEEITTLMPKITAAFNIEVMHLTETPLKPDLVGPALRLGTRDWVAKLEGDVERSHTHPIIRTRDGRYAIDRAASCPLLVMGARSDQLAFHPFRGDVPGAGRFQQREIRIVNPGDVAVHKIEWGSKVRIMTAIGVLNQPLPSIGELKEIFKPQQ